MTITIFEQINRLETRERTFNNVEYSKVGKYANEMKNTQELIFKLADKSPILLWSRVRIEDQEYDWEVVQREVNLIDKENEIYEHRIVIGELTHYFTKIFAPNLAFNQFLGSGEVNQFANLYEVIARVNRLVPFETVGRLQDTRLITSEYVGGTEPKHLMPLMTDRLKELLEGFEDVPEFQFSGDSLYEIYNKIIGLVGGVLRVKCTDELNKIMDVLPLDETAGIDVDINDYDSYSNFQSIDNYATTAEITTNNIVDNKALYIAGNDYFKHIQAKDKVIDESDAIINTEFNIWKLKKVTMKYKGTDTSHPQYNREEDITDYVLNGDQWNIVPIVATETEPAVSNSLRYEIDSNRIEGFAQSTPTGGIFNTSTIVWTELADLKGFTDLSDLRNYLFQVEFIAFQKGNRMHINQISYVENNKETYAPINIGGRINEASNVIQAAQNRVSRIGVQEIQKRVYHKSMDDLYPLKARDIDTQLFVVGIEAEQLKDYVVAHYYLTSDINKISDYVGVNTEKWWTDVEIGTGTVRNEIYKDHVIFAPDTSLYDVNDTALKTEEALNYAINLLPNNHTLKGNYNQAFVITSQDIPVVNRPLKQPIFMTGNRHLSMYLDFLNQTFVDNQVIAGGARFNSKDVERGVRYTQADGRLSTLNLAFGFSLNKDKDTITQAQTRLLPEAQDLIITDPNDPGYFQPLIEIGKTVVTETPQTAFLDEQGVTKTFKVRRWNNTEQSIETQQFAIPIAQQRVGRVRVVGLIESLNAITVPTRLDINIKANNKFGVEVYNATRVISGFLLISKKENPASFTLNSDISNLEITVTGRFEDPFPIKRNLEGLVGYKDLLIEYTEVSAESGEGLFVDKNQNETLGINYQLNYITAPQDYGTYKRDRIVLGDAITTNNPFLPSNDKNYTEFEVWKSSERYGIYESEKKGEKIEGASFGLLTQVVQIPGQTLFEVRKPMVFNVSLQPHESYAIVGVREDGKKDFMYAVNPRDDQKEIRTQDHIYVYFRHKNPLEV